MSNICCRIFKEQIELIKQLPEQDRALVLYAAVIDAFNQFDNQIENQNENAYISVSVSVSNSVSAISKTVLNLLRKNIICKEFSMNYGGKRKGSGRKQKDINPNIHCNYPGHNCGNLNKDCANCKENEFAQTKSYDPYPPF